MNQSLGHRLGLLLNKMDRRALLLVVLLAIYSLAVSVLVAFEHQRVEDAVLVAVCRSVYMECTPGMSLAERLTNLILGVTTVFIVMFFLTESVQGFLQHEFGGKSMIRKIDSLKNHYVVVGYGSLGRTVAAELEKGGLPYVVVDKEQKIVKALHDEGILAVEGDALEAKTLQRAGVERAAMVIGALGSDSSNVFLALTAKELNPFAKVATRACHETAVGKLHRAGAEVIVMPEIIGGRELAKEVIRLCGKR